MHSLNNSISKQKFSFPKTERFKSNDKLLYYLHLLLGAILIMKFQPLKLIEPPHSAMEKSQWELIKSKICLGLALTQLKANLVLITKKEYLLEKVDK
jgi:hypothetical protein